MTTKQALQRNGDEVDFLRQCLTSAEQGLGGLENAVRVVLQRRSWERRRDPASGNIYACDSFADLMTSDPPRGLGWTLDDVRRICRDDVALCDLFDEAIQRGNNVTTMRPDGNTAQKAIRRLRKDRPDLHEMVLNRELSPHAAMVEAGFRDRTVTIPVGNREKSAAAIARHFDAETISEALQLLKRDSAA